MNPLKHRVALVTGASAGIGEAVARALAAEGADVILCARRRDRLERIASEIGTAHDVKAVALEADVSRPEAVADAISKLPTHLRKIDILINNAGLARSLSKAYETEIADIDEMVDTNVKGLLFVTRAVVPGMVERGRGHIVNIGSIAGHSVYPGSAVYCSTKFAVNAITQGLKIDLHGTPVRVSTVDPGMVETDFSVVRFRGDAERAATVYADTRPLEASDVAEAVIFCITRPERVNISEIIMTSVDQSAATMIHRRQASESA